MNSSQIKTTRFRIDELSKIKGIAQQFDFVLSDSYTDFTFEEDVDFNGQNITRYIISNTGKNNKDIGTSQTIAETQHSGKETTGIFLKKLAKKINKAKKSNPSVIKDIIGEEKSKIFTSSLSKGVRQSDDKVLYTMHKAYYNDLKNTTQLKGSQAEVRSNIQSSASQSILTSLSAITKKLFSTGDAYEMFFDGWERADARLIQKKDKSKLLSDSDAKLNKSDHFSLMSSAFLKKDDQTDFVDLIKSVC